MNNTELLKNLAFNLSAVSYSSVGTEWNYKDVISSFSRLLLITEGEAFVSIGDKKVHLKKGNLYLIPSFTHCSYVCNNEMTHYYATFTIQLPNDLNIYQLFNFKYEVEANDEIIEYVKKLNELNPYKELPAKDPKIYQRINSKYWNVSIEDAQQSLISSGLLYLLVSKFIGATKVSVEKEAANSVLTAINYIQSNLNNELTVSKLSETACLSSGYFSKKFKELTQFTPIEYINKQRLEKAQLLLNTTTKSCIEIASSCGFKSNAYFCKMFKKYVGQTPNDYRNKHC
ncbi:transcriptional regulator, AraC family [Lutibacter oricola]|uniref:Transcriptional regulator, AraC family n=1 Tax=Lutibacter oricola TaxID=762486 RepID=A0A1H2SI66_9FLAO|nr:AraC family transcriptional regulator [Lutibacter oricola]SDW31393.1 transcriptional regulator, AraC family [Lutibacter oricola]